MEFNLINSSTNHTTQINRVKMLILGSGPAGFAAALWDLRGLYVVLQSLVILTFAMGIAIVLNERKKKNKPRKGEP